VVEVREETPSSFAFDDSGDAEVTVGRLWIPLLLSAAATHFCLAGGGSGKAEVVTADGSMESVSIASGVCDKTGSILTSTMGLACDNAEGPMARSIGWDARLASMGVGTSWLSLLFLSLPGADGLDWLGAKACAPVVPATGRICSISHNQGHPSLQYLLSGLPH
jgi:hypothetical protein